MSGIFAKMLMALFPFLQMGWNLENEDFTTEIPEIVRKKTNVNVWQS